MKIPKRRRCIDGKWIFYYATFVFFYCPDFARLLLDTHTLVDDADATLLGDGDGQTRFGHRVHGGRQQWDAHVDCARQRRVQ